MIFKHLKHLFLYMKKNYFWH